MIKTKKGFNKGASLLNRFFISYIFPDSLEDELVSHASKTRAFQHKIFAFASLAGQFDDSFQVDCEYCQCSLHLHVFNAIRYCPLVAVDVFQLIVFCFDLIPVF